MEEEDEDSIYAPAEGAEASQGLHTSSGMASTSVNREGKHDEEDGEEEGEEVEDEESDSVGAVATNFLTQILSVLP